LAAYVIAAGPKPAAQLVAGTTMCASGTGAKLLPRRLGFESHAHVALTPNPSPAKLERRRG
jgi:hypothetical protein